MYKGGKTSRELIAKDTGIGEKYSEQLYKLARKGFDRMSLTLYKSENNRRMYFESMLVQGGLPFFAIAEMKNNNNGLKNYLKALIDEYEDMNIVDWSDTSLVRSLARSYINNSIFEKSDMFYEFSLEIVKSYLNGDENFKGYDAIQSIISQIRTEKKKKTTRQNTLFRVIWQIRKSGPDINIGYSVRIPNEINAGDINKSAAGDENSKIVYFYINGRMIVSYYCHGDKFSRMPGSFGDEIGRASCRERVCQYV